MAHEPLRLLLAVVAQAHGFALVSHDATLPPALVGRLGGCGGGSPEGGHRTRRQAPDAAVGHCSQATDAVDPKAEATAEPPHLGAWAQPRTPGAAAPHRFETEGARPCGRHCRARPGFCCA